MSMHDDFMRTLLIDADDTLWENNIFFERAVKEFTQLMLERNLMAERIEALLRHREMENVKHYGYGSESLYRTMLDVYHEACADEGKCAEAPVLAMIEEFRELTGNYRIELLDGVKETLPRLCEANRLILLTKGNEKEQMGKVERSGLSGYFKELRVVGEKEPGTYRALLIEFNLNADDTWMVGNSPRSDINPAKAVGMGTVLIPYHSTWVHELEEISAEGRETIVLDSFSGLLTHFGTTLEDQKK
jgi:putative hydrolase of the HAD superfamily